jgi:ATP-dependent Clp protease ATP-binding subunit ClpA
MTADKSIDLVDEACAKVRVTLDSQPEILDKLERQKLQLEIEKTALRQEKDQGSKACSHCWCCICDLRCGGEGQQSKRNAIIRALLSPPLGSVWIMTEHL